jgi:hypothetical protein
MLIIALDPASYEKVAGEFSYTLFLTTTICNPGQELQLQDQGIAMVLKLNPFGDPGFEREALKVLKLPADGARGPVGRCCCGTRRIVALACLRPGSGRRGTFFVGTWG